MIAEGRTMRAAVEAGTLYQVTGKNWGKYGAEFPAAETPAEAAQFLLNSLESDGICPMNGERFEVRRVLDSTIGCTVVGPVLYIYHYEKGQLV
jgi:hypothetical protein